MPQKMTKGKMGLKTRGSSATAKHTDSPAKETAQTTGSEIQTLSKEEILKIDAEVLDGMGSLNRGRLTKASPDTLTLRQMQAAGAEFLASLVAHPSIRKGVIEAAIKDPVAILKIASSERPKEVHLEAEVNHSVVVVPAQQTPEEWEKQVRVIEGEVLKEESW